MAGKQALVEQIKELQRNGAREQWIAYCESNGTSKRDPNTHDIAFLSAFLIAHNNGQTFTGATESDLVAQVKAIQREGGKLQWWAYCDEWGEGTRDPTKHDEAFLQGFISSYNPSANDSASGPLNMSDLVKKGQRGSTNFKNAWAQYAAVHGNGKNDPTKYNDTFIVGFLDNLASGGIGRGGSYGSAGVSKKGGGGGPYSGGKGGGKGGKVNLNTKVDLGALLTLLGAQ
jgi:hypothetical protein